MDNPNINTIRTMPKEELAALHSKLYRKIATHAVGMIFLKLALMGVTRTLAQKALIEAAKRA